MATGRTFVLFGSAFSGDSALTGPETNAGSSVRYRCRGRREALDQISVAEFV